MKGTRKNSTNEQKAAIDMKIKKSNQQEETVGKQVSKITKSLFPSLSTDEAKSSDSKQQTKPVPPDFWSSKDKEIADTKVWGDGRELQKPVPAGAKYGRFFDVKRKEIEPTLFPDLDKKEKYEIIIGSKKDGVKPLDVKRVGFALREALYNQSYQTGHAKDNTGIVADGKFTDGTNAQVVTIDGKQYNSGEVRVKLSDLAYSAYGRTDGYSRIKTEKTLQALNDPHSLIIKDSAGNCIGRSLLHLEGFYYDAKTGAKVYDIKLHPIWTKDVDTNFALHKQKVLTLIGRLTEAKFELLNLLGQQDRRKPCIRYIGTLLREIGLYEIYKEQKKRTQKQLRDAINSMVNCGLLLSYKEEKANGTIRFVFHLNPDYGKQEQPTDTKRE